MERLPIDTVASVVLLAAIAPAAVRFFREPWLALDREALALRSRLADERRLDLRALATFVLGAFSLALVNYYSNSDAYRALVRPHLDGVIDLARWDELAWRVWWGVTRVVPYLLPVALWWPLFRDHPRDLGLRMRGFSEHLWIYLACVAVMIPVLAIVARLGDFVRYYPFYDQASRSWLDFGAWEVIYIAQFFALEVFFRGFWLHGARGLGSPAILTMVAPYAMIHFEKPYLETCGALVAGTVLGTLSMKTRSMYAGFLVHVTVAVLMDLLALERKGQLPARLVPDGPPSYAFPYLQPLLWGIWVLVLVALGVTVARLRRRCAGKR